MNAKTLTIASAIVVFMLGIGQAFAQDAAPAAPTAPAATDTAAPAPDVAVPVANTEGPTTQVTNPYGLGALIATGDFVSHGVLTVLALM